MNAIHSNWTRPFFIGHHGKYYVEDFELLTTILSALKWQQFNGDIKMVTDEVGYDYYTRLGLEHIWNLGIEKSLDKWMDDEIDPYTFWAAGKLYALKNQEEPCVMLDTDFIIWDTLTEELKQHEIAVVHREEIAEQVYPDSTAFRMKPDYLFKEELDWKVKPCNTAFAYISDMAFKNYYIDMSIDFMKHTDARDPLIYMVFAEQRLISMCAEEKEVDIFSFSDVSTLFNSSQKLFTHIWGYKSCLKTNIEERRKFCKRCVKRIIKDFPDMEYILRGIESLKVYIE